MKILIIKLGAKGDVIRTLSILPALKEKYPEAEISWLTKEDIADLITNSPYIDKTYSLPNYPDEKFDLLLNFDIEDEATSLASKIQANKKLGFYKENEYASAFNLGAEYYLNTLFDDEIKKNNKLTYQEMMFKAAELEYKKQHHPIYLNDTDKKYAEKFIKQNNINKEKLIGIHIGSAPRWPSKAWSENKIKEFIKQAIKKNYEILLFAGPDDIEKQEKISKELKTEGIKIYKNNPLNTNRQFASLINICNKIISSDTFALHVSLALKKPTIALFFCTSPNEIEDNRLLKKIVSPMLYNFFPQKQDQFSEELVNSISVEQVLSAIETNSSYKSF